jgi:hypothetical protein
VIRFFSIFLMFYFSSFVLAQASKTEKLKIPEYKLTWITKYHALIDFKDGSQAQLLAEQIPVYPLDFSLSMTDSTCPGFRPENPNCQMHVPFHMQLLGIFWTKYPLDPQKVGQLVKLKRYENSIDEKEEPKFKEAEDLFTNFNFADENTIYTYHRPVAEMDKWSMTCQEPRVLNSLMTRSERGDSVLNILSLSSELNNENPETNVDENRSASSLQDVIFTYEQNKYILQSIGNGMGGLTVLSSQAQNWVLSLGQEKACEIAFSVDFGIAATKIGEIADQKPVYQKSKPATWLGFIFGGKLNFQITRALSGEGVLE